MLIPPRAARVINSPGTRSDMDWRKIEQALIEIAKRQGGDVDRTDLGDLVLGMPIDTDLNLTELAKELAERLA